MELYSFYLTLLSLVALCACDGGQRLGGSYTDTLLSGLRRSRDIARRQTIVSSAVANNVYDECNALCPVGTVCSVELGIRECVPSGIAVVGSSYNDPIAPLTTDFSGYIATGPAVTVSGAAHLGGFASTGGRGVLLGRGFGFGANFGRLSACGFVPPECRVNRLKSRSFGSVVKYTFDYTLNQCVQIAVCSTCALISGPQDNLFNNVFSCNRLCQ